MEQYAFKMHLKPGRAREYRHRHDAIWLELTGLLRATGISDYSIFLDEETNILFGVLRRSDGHTMDELPGQEIMQRWWAHMADLMETEPDNEPVSRPLSLVFHME
jgi:L-rhamnose mutarotase